MNQDFIVVVVLPAAITPSCSPARVPVVAAAVTAKPTASLAQIAEAIQIAPPIVPLSFPEIAFQGNRSGNNEI